jgi:SAM-dependent methyltransferase
VSAYEDYGRTSESYDLTREPVGVEIIVGCVAHGLAPLAEARVLDAGCGTGAYARALLDHVGAVVGVDANAGMLAAATARLDAFRAQGRAELYAGSIEQLPLADASVDAAMINQVFHHLDDDPRAGHPAHRQVAKELARVLRPGGVLVVNISSHEQVRTGYWYYQLVPEVIDRLLARLIGLDALEQLLTDAGFASRGRFVPVDATLQARAYHDPRGPLQAVWRDGDSAWALLSDAELDAALERVRDLDRRGELEAFVARHDTRRRQVGQTTFLAARRAPA